MLFWVSHFLILVRPALEIALKKVLEWGTKNLVISFGVDPAEGDPICTFGIKVEDFKDIGVTIAGLGTSKISITVNPRTDLVTLGIPTLVVQEGGYSEDTILSTSASALIEGLLAGVPNK